MSIIDILKMTISEQQFIALIDTILRGNILGIDEFEDASEYLKTYDSTSLISHKTREYIIDIVKKRMDIIIIRYNTLMQGIGLLSKISDDILNNIVKDVLRSEIETISDRITLLMPGDKYTRRIHRIKYPNIAPLGIVIKQCINKIIDNLSYD